MHIYIYIHIYYYTYIYIHSTLPQLGDVPCISDILGARPCIKKPAAGWISEVDSFGGFIGFVGGFIGF